MVNVTLKEGAELKAYGRILKAGSKEKAIRRRIALIAQERRLPKADVRRAMRASVRRGHALIDFAIHYGINLDWLICGDIRGLKKN